MSKSSLFSPLRRFLSARRTLNSDYEPGLNFKELEESCIPSYAHPNAALGWVAWQRLEVAVKIWRNAGEKKKILDFGAGSGILSSLLPPTVEYQFAESDNFLADKVVSRFPRAIRFIPEHNIDEKFDVIFALDSLEHNENVNALLEMISGWIKSDGVFILSGPSENFLYRFGRWVAGYDGGYHHQTIYDIERKVELFFLRKSVKMIPLGLPLFRITSWYPKHRSV